MAKELADTDSDSEDMEDGFFDDSSSFEEQAVNGGRDNSIRRKIEERLERKRLMEELDLLDDFDL
ncbi:hypothetical protein I6N98_12475 [Spongiibacter nanhainus]|uniref:Uncharacterized protein n=1 Tax=Spongiibacter nanhainus TaxID=2794344 RepID=A0A7T4QYX0_9GAMM|nr:hypothetical protein [Spongiibacter nanhainus]QQD17177.1 hypothetical protein I6N98_12475 [Spongiibacter nanhainus]